VAGTGEWQVALVVALSMTAAVLLDGGPLIATAGRGAVGRVVTLLPPVPRASAAGPDAVIGGAVRRWPPRCPADTAAPTA
jgi:hypothetical protein